MAITPLLVLSMHSQVLEASLFRLRPPSLGSDGPHRKVHIHRGVQSVWNPFKVIASDHFSLKVSLPGTVNGRKIRTNIEINYSLDVF